MEKLMATLPNPNQSTLQINVVWLLGRRQAVMVRVNQSFRVQRKLCTPKLAEVTGLGCFPTCLPGAPGPAFRGTLPKP